MTNPLIAKYEEIYGKKEEPKPDYYKGEKSYAEELEEVEETYELPPEYVKPSQEQTDILNKYLESLNISYVPPQSVATSNTGITAANPYPKLTSYDNESLNDSFLQIAEKVKNKEAQIYSMNMDIDQQTRTQRITFEVWDTF